ncbi:hypothetical protein EVAR_47166_1 [Eumeta japonica]|uniref:G1/S-specific cyclin-E n=1 Tax=Eumeta variegata TaxID=151549 RepID=A0A4C1WX73_EUMVA|nr:hypothetical protein EVAR_47166_1 [Eumeta japonica]
MGELLLVTAESSGVSEVYKLHRETFHRTVDYIDRYLSAVDNVPKGRLQLIGITCLFVAAKVEEVYPPKVSEFAYVTDGACTTEEMLLEEMHIARILRWKLSPITCNEWLNMYMQLASEGRNAKNRMISERDVAANSLRAYTFSFPQYSSLDFLICSQLLDLAILHVDVNNYSYSVVAAATVAHMSNKQLAVRVSGYEWKVISPCYEWLQPFVQVVRSEGEVTAVRAGDDDFMRGSGGLAVLCPDINTDESHRIHVHNVTLDMFDKACQLIEEQATTVSVDTPSTSKATSVQYPTPPQSNEKDPTTPTPKTPSTSINPEPSFRPDIETSSRIPEVKNNYRPNLELE